MKTVVCYKWVVDEADITVNASDRSLNTAQAARKISLYDKNAIEMAVSLTQNVNGECIALSMGAEGADKSRKDIMSRGPQQGFFIEDSAFAQADSYLTSKVLAAKIQQIGDVDLVFCGEGAGDDYSQQVGPRIAQILGWPVITYANDVVIEGDKAIVRRVVEDGVEVIEAKLPAVVTVLGDCNVPRIPMMRDILSASKKPFEVTSAADMPEVDLVRAMETVSCLGNETNRKKILIEGAPQEAAAEMVRYLLQESVL